MYRLQGGLGRHGRARAARSRVLASMHVLLTCAAALCAGVVPAALAAAPAPAGFQFVPDPETPSLPADSRLEAVADVTGDGIPDLVLVDSEAHAVGVMAGNGAGGFGAPTWIPVGGEPWFVQVADLNNDGRPDLVVSLNPAGEHGNYTSALQVLLADGQGGFTGEPPITLPEPGPVYLGDFTGNGDVDALVTPDGCAGGPNDKRYYMLLGDGHGDLTPGPITESSAASDCFFLVGRFTASGRDDLLSKVESPEEPEAIVVMPGEADGSFGSPIVTPTPLLGRQSAFLAGAADLNGDGTLDLVTRSPGEPMGSVQVFDGNGAGGFTETDSFPSEQTQYSFEVALGDFSGDGHVDVATGGSHLAVLANAGTGALTPVALSPQEVTRFRVYVADVNGDGRPDLVLGDTGLQIFLDESAPPSTTAAAHAPMLSDLRESARVLRAGGARTQIHRRVPNRIVFSFSLDGPADVSFSFVRRVHGRDAHGRCVARTTRRSSSQRACTRAVQAGTVTFAGRAGANHLVFSGRISHARSLARGNYTLTARASNAAGSSTPAGLSFTIVA
jgi:hypothetical protein